MLSSSGCAAESETAPEGKSLSGEIRKDFFDELFEFVPSSANQSPNMPSTDARSTAQKEEKSTRGDRATPRPFDASSSRAETLMSPEQRNVFALERGALRKRQELVEHFVMGEVPRWHEAVVILHTLHVALEYEERRKQVPPVSSSNRHDAISSEEGMAAHVSDEFERTFPFVQFLETCTHISSCPTLQVPPLATTLRHCVREWADSRDGLTDALSHRSTVKELLELTEAAADAYGAAALSSPQSAPEALLLALLTDLCRYAMQLACTVIPHEKYPFSGASMDSVMAHNCVVIANVVEEQENYNQILKLLGMARSTAYHRCSEEVQASVSPLIAELLCIFDKFSLGSIEPLDKHKDESHRCRLTGLRLESNSSKDQLHPMGRWYWGHMSEIPIS